MRAQPPVILAPGPHRTEHPWLLQIWC